MEITVKFNHNLEITKVRIESPLITQDKLQVQSQTQNFWYFANVIVVDKMDV